jgi:hypothetical protein
MKMLYAPKVKYKEWEKVDDYTWIRKCLSNDYSVFLVKIKEHKGKYECEVPTVLPIKSLNSSKKFYISKITDHDSLIKSIIWVDTYLINEFKCEVEKPFKFNWSEMED